MSNKANVVRCCEADGKDCASKVKLSFRPAESEVSRPMSSCGCLQLV